MDDSEKRRLPPTIWFIGRSGSGKTTLIERLLPLLCERGLRVATLKQSHHKVEFDHIGKDSWRHRAAGASATLILSGDRFALFGDVAPFLCTANNTDEQSDEEKTERRSSSLAQALLTFSSDQRRDGIGGAGFDLLLIEGFKEECSSTANEAIVVEIRRCTKESNETVKSNENPLYRTGYRVDLLIGDQGSIAELDLFQKREDAKEMSLPEEALELTLPAERILLRLLDRLQREKIESISERAP